MPGAAVFSQVGKRIVLDDRVFITREWSTKLFVYVSVRRSHKLNQPYSY